MLLEESEQLTPCSTEHIGVRDAAHARVVAVAPHQEQVGRRQHRDGDACVRQLPRQRRDLVRRQQRQLGHVADHDPPAAPVFLGQLAHQMDVHRVGRVADVEMDVDIDVELARELEDAPDLPGSSVS